MLDERADLLFSFGGKHRGGGLLDGVAGTVELGAVAARPELVQRDALAAVRLAANGLRNDDVGATHAGEAAVFRKAAELDGHVLGTFDFEDRARDLRVLDEGLVGGVEENDRIVLLRILHPGFELGAGGDGTGRVVGEAEIDEVGFFVRNVRDKLVSGIAGQVEQAGVSAVLIGVAGIAGHHVGVHVNRIDRVGDGDDVALAEDVEDVAGIALRAIRDENFVGRDAEVGELVVDDCLAEELVALLGPVAFEGLATGHFLNAIVHRLNHGGGQRLGYIADATADDAGGLVRIFSGINPHPAGDFREQVTGFELEEIGIDRGHAGGRLTTGRRPCKWKKPASP